MKEFIIRENEAGQRADKFLKKYLSRAEEGFIYKMLRKKNITLNDKKINGSEKLCVGDSVKIYFSEETLQKFTAAQNVVGNYDTYRHKNNGRRLHKPLYIHPGKIQDSIIYEDENVILFNKPSGVLSQKACIDDMSVNELLLFYLLDKGKITKEQLETFKPSICNRLDRNTSGLIIFGKNLKTLQFFSGVLKDRRIHKYYLCVVNGVMKDRQRIQGYLRKSEKNNMVDIIDEAAYRLHPKKEEYSYIETEYMPLKDNGKYTLLKVHLVTGKPHQIRAHLANMGHALAGDVKYGSRKVNHYFQKKYELEYQLLHSYELKFDEYEGDFRYLSGKSFKAELPWSFLEVIRREGLESEY